MIKAEDIERLFVESLKKEGDDGAEFIQGTWASAWLALDESTAINVLGIIEQLPLEFFSREINPKGGDGWSFLNLVLDREGRQWTSQHLMAEKLLLLGLAVGRMEFVLPRDQWKYLAGGLPYIVIK